MYFMTDGSQVDPPIFTNYDPIKFNGYCVSRLRLGPQYP